MKFSVIIVTPRNYVHSEAFAETAETVHAGLRALGHEAVLTRSLAVPAGRKPIIFGANLLATFKVEPPPHSILYNLEQVQVGSDWLTPAMLDLFRRFEVWDYSERNADQLVAMGVPRPQVVPISYTASLTRIPRGPEDLDVLFYGSLNERRRAVLDGLRAAGVKVETLYGVFGAARDAVIARSKLVLNVHFYEAKVFEAVRVSYLLANRRAVVSETCADPAEEAPFAEALAFAPFDRLVATCQHLLADDAAREALASRGFEVMHHRNPAPFLRAALAHRRMAA
jgi:hypothetical protein